jgi:hypothetical protein
MLMRIRIRDPGIFLTLDPGSKKFGSEIRDKHPGSATLVIKVWIRLEMFLPHPLCVWIRLLT